MSLHYGRYHWLLKWEKHECAHLNSLTLVTIFLPFLSSVGMACCKWSFIEELLSYFLPISLCQPESHSSNLSLLLKHDSWPFICFPTIISPLIFLAPFFSIITSFSCRWRPASLSTLLSSLSSKHWSSNFPCALSTTCLTLLFKFSLPFSKSSHCHPASLLIVHCWQLSLFEVPLKEQNHVSSSCSPLIDHINLSSMQYRKCKAIGPKLPGLCVLKISPRGGGKKSQVWRCRHSGSSINGFFPECQSQRTRKHNWISFDVLFT